MFIYLFFSLLPRYSIYFLYFSLFISSLFFLFSLYYFLKFCLCCFIITILVCCLICNFLSSSSVCVLPTQKYKSLIPQTSIKTNPSTPQKKCCVPLCFFVETIFVISQYFRYLYNFYCFIFHHQHQNIQ